MIRILSKTAALLNKSALSGKGGFWDRMAVGVSGLCLVHCISTLALVAFLSSVGGILLNPLIHEIGMGIAILLAIFALGRGVLDHGYLLPATVGVAGLVIMVSAMVLGHNSGNILVELVFTMLGVSILGLGHYLNYRASH